MKVAHLIKMLEDNYHPDDEVFIERDNGDTLYPASYIEYLEAWYQEGYPQYRYDYHKSGHDRSTHVLVLR